MQEIQRDPLAFLRRVEAGEALLVFQGNRALAEVRPFPITAGGPRPYALAAGQFAVPDDFDSPLPEESDGIFPAATRGDS